VVQFFLCDLPCRFHRRGTVDLDEMRGQSGFERLQFGGFNPGDRDKGHAAKGFYAKPAIGKSLPGLSGQIRLRPV